MYQIASAVKLNQPHEKQGQIFHSDICLHKLKSHPKKKGYIIQTHDYYLPNYCIQLAAHLTRVRFMDSVLKKDLWRQTEVERFSTDACLALSDVYTQAVEGEWSNKYCIGVTVRFGSTLGDRAALFREALLSSLSQGGDQKRCPKQTVTSSKMGRQCLPTTAACASQLIVVKTQTLINIQKDTVAINETG